MKLDSRVTEYPVLHLWLKFQTHTKQIYLIVLDFLFRKCRQVYVYLIYYQAVHVWLSYLTSLSIIFQLYRGGQLHWRRKPEYPEKITDLSQVTDKLLSHNVSGSQYTSSGGIHIHNASGDRHGLHLGSYKSN